MNTLIKSIALATTLTIALYLLTGCASSLPASYGATPAQYQQMMLEADAGPEPTEAFYKRVVLSFLEKHLRDPDSALIKWSSPYKDIDRKSCRKNNCWTVSVEVNAKSAMGGYTGYKSYYFKVYKNEVFDIIY